MTKEQLNDLIRDRIGLSTKMDRISFRDLQNDTVSVVVHWQNGRKADFVYDPESPRILIINMVFQICMKYYEDKVMQNFSELKT